MQFILPIVLAAVSSLVSVLALESIQALADRARRENLLKRLHADGWSRVVREAMGR